MDPATSLFIYPVNQPIYPQVSPSIHPANLSIFSSIRQLIHISTHAYTSQYNYLSTNQSINPSISAPVNPSIHLSSTSKSIYPFTQHSFFNLFLYLFSTAIIDSVITSLPSIHHHLFILPTICTINSSTHILTTLSIHLFTKPLSSSSTS